MMKANPLKALFLTGLAALGFGAAVLAQNVETEREIDGKTYVLREGRWQFRASEQLFYDVDPQVLTVKFKDGTAPITAWSLHAALDCELLREAWTGFVDVRVPAGADIFEKLDAYRANANVEIAELNTLGRYNAVPDDPSYGSQWHHPVIRAPLAWDKTSGDPSVIIAVLDSGSNFTHPDFGPGSDIYENVWLNPEEDPWVPPDNPAGGDGIDGGNGFIDDWKGWDFVNNNNDSRGTNFHGSFVAGVLGAKTNNGEGIAGVAGGFNNEGVKVMICGVGDAAPSGAALDDAILYALDNGADVVQMSLTVGQAAAIDAAIDAAYNAGLFVVCASGNNNSTNMPYPANNQQVMAIGSTTQAEQRSSFSNFGTQLDVSAPGSSIFGLGLTGYTTSSGTSFAAPIISGVVGLMLSINPNLTNAEIYQILITAVDKVGGYDYNYDSTQPGRSFELGYGRIDAFEAVCRAGVDLMIQDAPDDNGRQPNDDPADDFWNSLDIWNCVDDPGCTEHEMPVYKPAGDNYLRVRVHNRGALASQPANLMLYWTRGRTGALWPNHWLDPNDPNNPGSNTINGQPGGGEITVDGSFNPDPVAVPAIGPGGDVTVTRAWQPPDTSLFNGAAPVLDPVLGLLARIESAEDPIFNENNGVTAPNVEENNNIAARAFHRVDLSGDAAEGPEATASVHNVSANAETLDLRLEPMGDNIADYPGEVTLVVNQALWDLWQSGGAQSQGVTVQQTRYLSVDDPTAGAWLQNISFAADERHDIAVQFSLPPGAVLGPDGETFTFQLEQYIAGASDFDGAVVYQARIAKSFLQLLAEWPAITILDLLNRLP